MSLLVLLALAAALGLLAFAGRVNDLRREAPPLEPHPPERFTPPSVAPRNADPRNADPTNADPTNGEPLLILLPCRNEEDHVGPCLDHLGAQTLPVRVRVIDDGSTDRTARRVEERLAAWSGRLELVSAPALPPSWRGKVHALHQGLRAAGEPGEAGTAPAPWILSTDADTRHAPEAAARALATAEARGLDGLSLAGYQETRTLGEALVSPLVFALLDALLGSWSAAARGEGPAVANGQYILLRRSALEAIGGFEAIRDDSGADDVALVRALARGGFRVGFFRAPEVLSVRMYRGLRETLRGWRRNLSFLLRGRPLATGLALGVTGGLPLALGLLLAVGHPLPAALLWAGGAGASMDLRRGSGHTPWTGILYPLDSLLIGALLVLGQWDRARGRTVAWKGRGIGLESSGREGSGPQGRSGAR